jgi:hypothetical protein
LVIDRDRLESMNPLTAKEVLRLAPGVAVVEEDTLGLKLNISVRGLNPRRSSRTLLMEDGVPIQPAPYADPSAHYYPPLDRVARIEFRRGSGQIPYGPQSVGGMINFVTQPAPAGPLAAWIQHRYPGTVLADLDPGLMPLLLEDAMADLLGRLESGGHGPIRVRAVDFDTRLTFSAATAFMVAREGQPITVDLEHQTVTTPFQDRFAFNHNPFRRDCLLNGLDEVGLTMARGEAIGGFEATRIAAQPWLMRGTAA